MSSVLAAAAELSADTEAADDHAPARSWRASCRRLRGPAWREALGRGLAKAGERECLTPAASSVYLRLMHRGPRELRQRPGDAVGARRQWLAPAAQAVPSEARATAHEAQTDG